MEFIREIQKDSMETIAPGIRRLVYTLNKVMTVYFEIDPGVVVGEHAHPHEQMGMLIRGKMRWNIQGQEKIIEAPALYRFPSNQSHGAEILGNEPALILDIFSPIREEFLKDKPPEYMRPLS
jgi:quercetin dioxygenase-like cupin family protein